MRVKWEKHEHNTQTIKADEGQRCKPFYYRRLQIKSSEIDKEHYGGGLLFWLAVVQLTMCEQGSCISNI